MKILENDSFYGKMISVYNGIMMINNHKKTGFPLNSIQKPSKSLELSISNIEKSFKGFDNIIYSTAINVGEPDNPLFIIVIENEGFKSIVDVAISTSTYNPIYVVMIPSNIFDKNISKRELISNIYRIYSNLLSYDKNIINDLSTSYNGVPAEIRVLNYGLENNKKSMIPTYDYAMIICAMYYINLTIRRLCDEYPSAYMVKEFEYTLKSIGAKSYTIDDIKQVIENEHFITQLLSSKR